MEYKIVSGWKFPQYESRLCRTKGGKTKVKGFKGLDTVNFSLQFVKKFDTMLDVGANVGLITVPMAEKFNNVISVECIPETFECLTYNTKDLTNVKTIRAAASNRIGTAQIAIPKLDGKFVSSGWASLDPHRKNQFVEKELLEVDTITIDSLNLTDLDFLKIDVEGAEMQVIKGAIKTILNYHPVIEFENKRNENLDVVNLLEKTYGYKAITVDKKSCDTVMYWPF